MAVLAFGEKLKVDVFHSRARCEMYKSRGPIDSIRSSPQPKNEPVSSNWRSLPQYSAVTLHLSRPLTIAVSGHVHITARGLACNDCRLDK